MSNKLFESYKKAKSNGVDKPLVQYSDCFSKYVIQQFNELECFDEKLFKKYFPEDPEYRGYVISYILSGISIAADFAPLPEKERKTNHNKKVAKDISNVINKLEKLIPAIDKLPVAFSRSFRVESFETDEAYVYRKNLDAYLLFLNEWKDDMELLSRNEVLFDCILLSFSSDFGIPICQDVSNNQLINNVISIFTGMDVLEVRRVFARYKDKKQNK